MENARDNDGGPLRCPVCDTTMIAEQQHGIEIDVCDEHGVWLDTGELGQVVAKLGRRARRGKARAVRSAKRDGKMSGALFGWWSLLGD